MTGGKAEKITRLRDDKMTNDKMTRRQDDKMTR